MRIRIFVAIGIASMILLTSGCAVAPKVEDLNPVSQALPTGGTLEASVDAPDPVRQMEGYNSTSAALLQEFIANVKATKKYATVGAGMIDDKAIQARLTITALNYVSGASRALTGIMGGRAVLSVKMTIMDKESGSVLGVVSAKHESSHVQGVFSPPTSRQVSAIAEVLAARLTKGQG